jgi:hypothetical protein
MFPKNPPFLVHDLSRAGNEAEAKKVPEFPGAEKAGFGAGGERFESPEKLGGEPFGFPKADLSQGQDHPGKLTLEQAVEKVALIPEGIAIHFQQRAIGAVHPGEMPACQPIAPRGQGGLEKISELETGVAGDAGAGGPPPFILREKRGDDLLLEMGGEIDHRESDPEAGGKLLDRAQVPRPGNGGGFRRGKEEVKGRHLVPFPLEQSRGQAAVSTSA